MPVKWISNKHGYSISDRFVRQRNRRHTQTQENKLKCLAARCLIDDTVEHDLLATFIGRVRLDLHNRIGTASSIGIDKGDRGWLTDRPSLCVVRGGIIGIVCSSVQIEEFRLVFEFNVSASFSHS